MTGTKLAEKLEGNNPPVALSKIACRGRIRSSTTAISARMTKSDGIRFTHSFLVCIVVRKALHSPLYRQEPKDMSNNIMYISNGEERLATKVPKNHLIPASLSIARTGESGIAAL